MNIRFRRITIRQILQAAELILIFFTIGVLSCRHDPEDLGTYSRVCFSSDVLPIFETSCAKSGCHTGNDEEGYSFTNYAGIMSAIVPGSPMESPAYKAITTLWGEDAMPPDQPLSEENRMIIRMWIEQGAENIDCSNTPGPQIPGPTDSTWINTRACFQRDILPLIQSNCAISGCHDAQSVEEGVILTNFNEIRRIVRPGNPLSSELYNVITTNEGEDRMPPFPYNQLTWAQIDTIYHWIRYGALNEFCGEACDTSGTVTFSGTIWPLIQQNCYGCHSGINAQKGIHLENYQDVSAVASNGMLIGSISGQQGYVKMPPAGSLSSCRISQVKQWINDGFPNN